MHMTSQKGAPVCWGSNEGTATCAIAKHACQRAKPCMPYRRAGPGPRTDWQAERQCALPAQHVRAARQVLTPNMASFVYGDVTSMHKVYLQLTNHKSRNFNDGWNFVWCSHALPAHYYCLKVSFFFRKKNRGKTLAEQLPSVLVRCPSSVNFLYFHLLLENARLDFNETWQELSLGVVDSKLLKCSSN